MHRNMIKSLQGRGLHGQFGLSQQSGCAFIAVLNELTVSCTRMCIGSWFRPWDPTQQLHRCRNM